MAGEIRRSSGVYVEDLNKLVRKLRQADRPAGLAVSRGLRKSAVMVQRTAHIWQKMQRRPRTPAIPGAISRYANQRSAGLILRGDKYPWAIPMEFGGNVAYLWGRTKRADGTRIMQTDLATRQFRPWVGNQHSLTRDSGYVVQRAIYEDVPRIKQRLAADVLEELAKYIGATVS